MTKPTPITVQIVRKTQFSPKVFLFTCRMENPQHVSFTPGQFISIDVDGTRRSYSVASPASNKTHIDFLVDVAPGGPGSKFFMSKQPGDTISGIGPMGNFTLVQDDGVMVFLATGTGVAPFKSMLDTLFERQLVTGDYQKRQLYFYFGFLWNFYF